MVKAMYRIASSTCLLAWRLTTPRGRFRARPKPPPVGAVEVTLLAQDSAGAAATLSFNVTVNPALSFGDLFGAAAGKANPASEHADFSIVVGQELTLPLPEVTGGTPPLTYSVAGLPAGLSFDPETRIVSGTPEAVTDGAVEVTYIVTDANGQTIGLPILVAVIPPPLAAPRDFTYDVYAGADGQGALGGFVLLTWGLSDHHGGIDGYRIYRELPVLGNEMFPWAFVDAVPEVEVGRAIVATLDGGPYLLGHCRRARRPDHVHCRWKPSRQARTHGRWFECGCADVSGCADGAAQRG